MKCREPGIFGYRTSCGALGFGIFATLLWAFLAFVPFRNEAPLLRFGITSVFILYLYATPPRRPN